MAIGSFRGDPEPYAQNLLSTSMEPPQRSGDVVL